MKTFQIFRTITEEYFVDAKTEEEAFEYIYNGSKEPDEHSVISENVADIWENGKWQNEESANA